MKLYMTVILTEVHINILITPARFFLFFVFFKLGKPYITLLLDYHH